MKKFPELSIRTQLLFLAILLTLPALVIIIYGGLKERRADIERAAIESEKLAVNIAAAQENITKEALQFGKLIAGLPDVKKRRPIEVQYILSNICKDNPQYLSIAITDRTGKAWAAAYPITNNLSFADRRYFKSAQYSLRFSSGEFALSKTTGKPTLTVGYPLIAEDGDFDGVIALSFDLNRLKPILDRSRLPEDTDYVVSDHAGVIISRGQGNDRLVGSRIRPETLKYMEDTKGGSTYHYIRSDGDERITSFRKLWLSWEDKPYMYVRAGISFDKVVAKSNRSLAYNIALLLPFVILSFGVAFYIGKRSIADKVSLLERSVRNLSEGKLQGKVTDLVKGGELGKLGLAFDDMTSQLKVREESVSEHAIALEKEIIVRIKTEEALSVKQLQLEELNSLLEERVTATVNELREKDKILVNQSRLAAMGEMINNIAHQWRQPLNNIGLTIQNIEYDYNNGKTDRNTLSKDITSVMDIIKYMSRTIDDFRNFFKIDKEKTLFSLNKTIGKAIDFMKSGLQAHNIMTEVVFEDDVMVDGYENEYIQVLLNIINNAKDAFLEQKINRPCIRFKLTKENGRSILRIRDNAGGIDSTTLPKIFDPYFSTKFNTQGTGIGLYMSKMIIEQNMGGELTAYNVEDGAEFCIVV